MNNGKRAFIILYILFLHFAANFGVAFCSVKSSARPIFSPDSLRTDSIIRSYFGRTDSLNYSGALYTFLHQDYRMISLEKIWAQAGKTLFIFTDHVDSMVYVTVNASDSLVHEYDSFLHRLLRSELIFEVPPRAWPLYYSPSEYWYWTSYLWEFGKAKEQRFTYDDPYFPKLFSHH